MITIIPAIDLIGGKCVRLSNGDFSTTKTYRDNPVDVAREFEAAGITRLHIVDLDGAKSGAPVNLSVLEEIAKATNLLIDFGGGIKTDEDVQRVIDAGVTYVSVGSIAVKEPETLDRWIRKYSADKFFLGADVREGKIAVSGWQEQTEIDVVKFIHEHMTKRISHVFCTDISKDGLLNGPSTELYKHILAQCPGLRLVASGGVSCIQDIHELNELGCDGVIVGKAIYEGKIALAELGLFNGR
ncbi:MAG: 1-(5-phosphoribosyl)-5-[(5-phosphoribosylamino)methylideneamino]imidazole-4-carboxamide isomerase [Bacteroidota bacterium]|nr:1-(5-phosphoribosyl)-5-[(5-phosphoribosylamino)methylideneamino]imidazole-4-carboxamide isomerase [Bacteroidota bacterium]